MRATCLDVSSHGACIECGEPIEIRAHLNLQAPAYGLMGNASVRYCKPAGRKYRIGLEFSWAATLADTKDGGKEIKL